MSIVPIPADTISAEDHVNLGIKFHEQDLLPQSTHHLSLAAEMGSPTGMLLYSLSLRHGWGCAANQEKAVDWLHAAAESASAEVDGNGVRRPNPVSETLQFNSADGKRGGATLALAIYELGQSYMNGWGVAKDKHLALRCFEISANFGDTDGQWYSLPSVMLTVVKRHGVIYMGLGRRRM
jgi:TPR repeat protein